MPPSQDEVTLVTVFADVHYLFTPPNHRPIHHRFDKRSYAYIYQDRKLGRLRLEIANNVGTPTQDAFAGSLDASDITYSPDRPTFLSFTTIPVSVAAKDAWQMWDPTEHDSRRLCLLYGIDMYFWTQDEAVDFVKALRTPPLSDMYASAPYQAASLSPAASQVEQLPIRPASHSRKSGSSSTGMAPLFPPIPTEPATEASRNPNEAAPPAYNPAAPIAPEHFHAREERNLSSFGPGAAVPDAEITNHGFTSPSHMATSFPLSPETGFSPQRGLSYQMLAQQRQGGTSASTTPKAGGRAFSPRTDPGYFPPPPPQPQPIQQEGQQQQLPPASAPAQGRTLSATLLGHVMPLIAPPTPTQQQPPPGGYANYTYAQSNPSTASADAHEVHSQLYRPTEAEAQASSRGGAKLVADQPAKAGPGQASAAGKLEVRAERLEKGVNRFLKKLDGKWA